MLQEHNFLLWLLLEDFYYWSILVNNGSIVQCTDVNTRRCRDLCYAVNAVLNAQQELYGDSLRMQVGGQAGVVTEEEKGGKSLLGQSGRHGVMTCH